MNGRNRKSFLAASRGSVMLEFATTALIFFMTFVAIFDVCKIVAVKMILLKGAHEALSLAQKDLHFRIDTRELDLTDYNDRAKYERLVAARARILDEAVSFPLNTLLTESSGIGGARLRPFQMTDRVAVGSPILQTADALILRPGESGSQGSTPFDHHSLCAPTSGTCPVLRRMPDFQTFREALVVHPLEVYLRADVSLISGAILPFLSEMTVTEKAAGWSEVPRNTFFQTDSPPPGSPPPTVTTTTVTITVTTTTESTTTLFGDTTLPPSSTTTISTTTSSTTSTTLYNCVGDNNIPPEVVHWGDKVDYCANVTGGCYGYYLEPECCTECDGGE